MLDVTPLSPALAKIAQTELNEDESSLPQSIEILREWVKMQPHLNCPMDDKFFLYLLRASKHSIEKAKNKIDSMITLRTLMPDYFGKRNVHDEKVANYLRMGAILHLPKTEGEGCPRILIMRSSGFDASKYPFHELINATTLQSDLRYEIDDVYRVVGVKLIVDLANFTPALMAQCDAVTVKKLIMYYHEVMSVRVKGLYVINLSPLALALTNMVKMFLSDKLKSRLFLFNSIKDFSQKFPTELLPEEYGGSAGKYDDLMEQEIDLIKKHWDNIKKWYDYGVDESKRFGKPKTSAELFGVDGTFRNLQYD